MFDLEQYAIQQLKYKENQKLLRVIHNYRNDGFVKHDSEGKALHDFTSNDYFGMANDAELVEKIRSSITNIGSGGSRLISGSSFFYKDFEDTLAMLHQTEKSVIFGSGYLASLGFYKVFCGKDDVVIADKNIHACHIDGISLSGAKLIRFRHNDVRHLKDIMLQKRSKYSKCFILTESLFSMHGDFAPLSEISNIASKYNCHLLVDDAHGFLISDELSKLDRDNLTIFGTLSKSVGSYGGYICSSKNICDYLVSAARSLIYSTALPEFVVMSGLESLKKLVLKKQSYQKDLHEKISFFCKNISYSHTSSPIVIVEVGSIDKLNFIYNELCLEGFLVGKIRPPTAETPRLRLSISTKHSMSVLANLAEALIRNIELASLKFGG